MITGDNLLADLDAIAANAPSEMFTGAAFPDKEKVASINAYLGAFPIARALAEGADIVITGRCVDSAVTLGACIHEFGWSASDHDLLASGSLAGHLLECGPQATGGNYTDWEDAGDIANIGYPIGAVSADGSFTVSKPEGTGGCVTVGTVSEQMLYEIGDPQSLYATGRGLRISRMSRLVQTGPDMVHVSAGQGYLAPDHYKTCLTYGEGFVGGLPAPLRFEAGKKPEIWDMFWPAIISPWQSRDMQTGKIARGVIVTYAAEPGRFKTGKYNGAWICRNTAAKHRDSSVATPGVSHQRGTGQPLSGFLPPREYACPR